MAQFAGFEDLVNRLLSADNTVRQQAEACLNELKNDPNNLVAALVTVFRNPAATQEVRQMAVSVLRPLLVKQKESVWPGLLPQTQQAVKAELLNAIQQERSPVVLRKLCDCIADVCLFLQDKGGWQELLPFIFGCTNSAEETHRESALNIFSQLAVMLGAETFRAHFPLVKNVLQRGLTDMGSLKIRLAALNATSCFLQIMEKEDDAHATDFQSLLPAMLECISTALNQSKENEAQKAMEVFVELAEIEPLFFRPSIGVVVNAMLVIAQAAQLQDETRRFALEVLLTLCESRPAMMKKQPEFVKSMIPLLLQWMVGVEDDRDWYEFEDSEEGTNAEVAEGALDRFCLAIKGKTIVPILFGHINTLLASADWRHRHAGVLAISIAGEGCRTVLKNHTNEIVKNITAMFSDPHPRVRWAAANCVGQLCTDFGPELQSNHGNTLVPLIVQIMNDQIPRVAAHGATCVINFFESSLREAVAPHIPIILQNLQRLVQSAPIRVQEVAITALSSVVESVDDAFAPYYDQFVPYLKLVVKQAGGQKDYRLIRGKAIECLSLIGCAVKKERFVGDAKEVLDLMLTTQCVEADDPQISYLESAFARLAECLGRDFAPYLPVVMPSAIQRASMKADISVFNDEEEAGEGWEVYSLGDKAVGIHTARLEEKAAAAQILLCYAVNLGASFFPYVEEVAKIATHDIFFYYHDAVRGAFGSLLSHLLKCTSEHLREIGSVDRTPLVQLWQFMFEPLIKALPDEPENDIKSTLLQAFYEGLETVGGPCINPEQLKVCAETFKTMLNEWIRDKDEREKKKAEGEHDEEDAENIDEVEIMCDEVLGNIGDCIGRVFQFHGATFVQPFSEYLLPVVNHMIKQDRSVPERQKALCIFDDLIEHAGQASVPFMQHYMSPLLHYTNDPEPCVVQAAVFGLGVAGQVLGDHFAPFINEALPRLQAVALSPKANEDSDYKYSVDNAISAVGKIIRGQSKHLNVRDLLPSWVTRLPLKNDDIESRLCNKLLCTFVEEQGLAVLGNADAATHVVKLFADVTETEFLAPEDVPRASRILRQIVAQPGINMEALAATLTPVQREKLQRLMAIQ